MAPIFAYAIISRLAANYGTMRRARLSRETIFASRERQGQRREQRRQEWTAWRQSRVEIRASSFFPESHCLALVFTFLSFLRIPGTRCGRKRGEIGGYRSEMTSSHWLCASAALHVQRVQRITARSCPFKTSFIGDEERGKAETTAVEKRFAKESGLGHTRELQFSRRERPSVVLENTSL